MANERLQIDECRENSGVFGSSSRSRLPTAGFTRPLCKRSRGCLAAVYNGRGVSEGSAILAFLASILIDFAVIGDEELAIVGVT